MNTVVCIKQVAHVYVSSGIDLKSGCMVENGIVYLLNPYDEVAVEEALRIRDAAGSGKVTVVTVGPPQAAEVLRWCLAMGADHAIHVVDDAHEVKDPLMVSHVLEKVFSTIDYDLVFCGKVSIDDGMGQVGHFLGELLGLPVVSAVASVELDLPVKCAVVQRVLEKGNREVVRCPIPALFTTDMSLNKPRYPTLQGRQKALGYRITAVSLGELGMEGIESHLELVHIGPPKLRPRKVLAPDSSLSAAGRLNFIVTGGAGEKKGGNIGGDPEQLAKGIIDFLIERKFITN